MASNGADAAIFDPDAWRLTGEEAEIAKISRELGESKFAGRAWVCVRNRISIIVLLLRLKNQESGMKQTEP